MPATYERQDGSDDEVLASISLACHGLTMVACQATGSRIPQIAADLVEECLFRAPWTSNVTMSEPMPVVEFPTDGVDARAVLATALHAAPGVYAVLVGSGMSSAAGIPTGWQVVQDLIRKVALAEGSDPAELGDKPEEWWAAKGHPDPRYDTLLAQLAPTDAARQALLRKYFETLSDGRAVQPTAGHRALAKLAARGLIRVILTTNFDRLIERALDQAGVAPQVIVSSGAINGMTPLVHAPITVIKLNGDYLSFGQRNTPDELGQYPEETTALLARVFDEYGLLVVGWSAEYDKALVEALESAPSRRYPTFWCAFNGNLSEPARRLVSQRQACVINIKGADEFFEDVVQKIARLDRIAQRRRRPTPLRSYRLPPESASPPQGWQVLPLLQLRAVALVGPASSDNCGLIRAESREALVEALRKASLTDRLRTMGRCPGAYAIRDQLEQGKRVDVPVLEDWVLTPGGHQSYDYCTYRLGGDATVGISSLVTVRLPGYPSPTVGDSVCFSVDVALSLQEPIEMFQAAMILRDGLVLVATALPEALADILPSEATSNYAEVHLLAAKNDGTLKTQDKRKNDLLDRIDLSPLGTFTREMGQLMGFAAELPGPLSDREAADLVCEAIEHMAYAAGNVDPRRGIQQLRDEMGLLPPTSTTPNAGLQ